MRRLTILIGLLATAAPAAAQTRPVPWGVGVAVGPAFPAGHLATSFNPGVGGLIYFTYGLAPHLAFGFDVGTTRLPGIHGGHGDFPEVMVGLLWRPVSSRASLRPFLLAGMGSLALNGDDPDDGAFAFGVGGGVSFGGSGVRGFALVRCLRAVTGSGATVVPLTIGISTRAP
ncbi:MAG TPA: outer membrane beta-barrel protein [Gemmatimonadales bacterium]|nr:outer membrane beta-barrel protein [Gemmatimonadales bacterium]